MARKSKPNSKRHRTVTPQQRKLLTGIAKGMTISAAGRAANYSHAQSAIHAYHRMREKVPAVLEALGCPIEKVLQKVVDKLEAKETKFFASEGIVLDEREVEAHGTQLEAASLLLDCYGAKDKTKDAGEDQGSGPSVRVSLSVLMSDEAGEILDME